MAKAEENLEDLLEGELQKGYFSAYFVECGFLDRDASCYQKSGSTLEAVAQIFDLASLTKALVTAPLVHRVLQDVKLDKTALVQSWSTELSLPSYLLELSTESLLGHVSGLPAWWNFWMGRFDQSMDSSRATALSHMQEVLKRIPLAEDPSDLYSDVGYILLGYALEVLKKQDLAQQFQSLLELFQMPSNTRLGFAPKLNGSSLQYIPTGYCRIRERRLRGEVHDENCAAFQGISGHAGLFGSGTALAGFLKSMYRHPLGRSYLDANEAVRLSTQRESLLGLRRGNGRSAELFAKAQGMGHLGFTGTAFWIEQKTGKYAIFLSNRVISGRVSSRITEIRRSVFQYLDECIVE